jgi:hypothetical protein
VVIVVVLAGGWLWFGNSGVALLGLWVLARRPWACLTFVLDVHSMLLADCLMTPWWMTLTVTGRQLEVFRDEVTASEWSRLRRCLVEGEGLS